VEIVDPDFVKPCEYIICTGQGFAVDLIILRQPLSLPFYTSLNSSFNMSSMYHGALLLFALILFIRAAEGSSDPLNVGSAYLMSVEVEGDDYYLGCGDDFQCSILPISDAELHDGWTVHNNGDGTWGFRIRGDSWALDVHANGFNIFADTETDSHPGERWGLFRWSDGTYQLYNNFWQKNLDVKNNVTPFMNSNPGPGQHWYFRSVEPLTTVTSTITSTSIVDAQATSTVTQTITTCLGNSKVTTQ
jgi:hypothetical protein